MCIRDRIKDDKGWSDLDLVHELVNHSQGQIVNDNGYSTNQIEAKWSVLKRWIRKRSGGKLPGKKDRAQWKIVLQEFQWRKHLQYQLDVTNDRLVFVHFFRAVAANMAASA